MFSPGIVADELQGYVGRSHLFGELAPANRIAVPFFGFLAGRERDRPRYWRVSVHLRASIHLFRSTLLSTGVIAADVPSLAAF